jgi:hypothetical protein
VIARIVIEARGKIAEIDTSVRQHANGRFSGNLTIGQGGNKVLNVRQIDGKHWLNDTADDLYLNWNSGKSVHLGFGEGTKSSLYVSGNVVVGTGLTNENHKLVIRGPNEPENESGHQDLSYEFNVAGSAKIRAYRGAWWDTYLQFLTNARDTGTDNPQVRLHIDQNGNVGVGTAEPKAKLDIDGNAMLGYETQLPSIGISDFGAPIKSGFYQNGGAKITGDVPDASHKWTHLITARHSNTATNHQLQIAASYADNDKLYFRKIAAEGTSNPAWHELATRGTNQFVGDQTVNGNVVVGTGLTNEKHKLVIRGPNEPENESGHQDLSYEFNVAGSAKIRAYRGRSWDTYLQFLTNAAGTGGDNPQVRLHIDHNGNVGIGTTGPLNGATDAMGLHVRAGTMATLLLEQTANDAIWKACGWRIRTGASGALVIDKAGATPDPWVQINDNLRVAGDVHARNFPASSDERLKTRISPLVDVLHKLDKIRGVSFEWNELYSSPKVPKGRKQIGVIAQEVEAVFPELVTTWGEERYRAVDYSKLTAVLIEAIKELRRENDSVRGRLEQFMETVLSSRPSPHPE